MKKNYFTQFDTIRFLAMLCIILYNYLTHRVSGGFLGVDIFLVLSGYLVTSQMESKYQADIDEGSYFKKTLERMRKVWWPMVIITMVGLTYLLLFRQQLLVNIGINLSTSLLFVNNWQQILSGSSYFANMLHPSLTTHYCIYPFTCSLWSFGHYSSRLVDVSPRPNGNPV